MSSFRLPFPAKDQRQNNDAACQPADSFYHFLFSLCSSATLTTCFVWADSCPAYADPNKMPGRLIKLPKAIDRSLPLPVAMPAMPMVS